MASDFGKSTNAFEQSPSYSANSSNDVGDFECNICLDLAQDPVITLCGHLFCWPCLYRWLHHHSHCQECPVCKALVQEEKLVPLYGRGKTQTDPRTKSYPGMEIPHRPSGQRPPTAPLPPDANPFRNSGFGLMGGFLPMASARIGSLTLATAFGGFIPSLLNIHLHGIQDAAVYGAAAGIPFVVNTFHGNGNARGFPQATGQVQQPQEDHVLKNLFLLIGFLVLLTVIFVW